MNKKEERRLIGIVSSMLNSDPEMNANYILSQLKLFNEDLGLSYRSIRRLVRKVKDIPRNVLVIGDLHEPFTRNGYLEHCTEVHKNFKCTHVVLIGDIIDNHFSSYHETDPDGLSAGDELDFAVKRLKKWHDAFPGADVTLGNHDLLVMRKAMSSGVSKRWIKEFQDVLEVPTWRFHHEIEIDNVLYHHGTGTSGAGAAQKRAMERGQSVAIGHIHTHASITWNANKDKRFFALMTGCGLDEKAYAAEYGKNFPRKMIISCATVLNNGTLPIIHPMEL